MTTPSIETAWAEQAAGMTTVEQLAGLWADGADELGLDGAAAPTDHVQREM